MSLDQNPKDLELAKLKRVKIDGYILGEVLGEGAFGRVFKAKNKETEVTWALKRLKKAHIISSQQVDHLRNESYILGSLSHPFIVALDGLAQDSRYLFLAMELVSGGELFEYLRNVGRLSHSQTAFYAAQVTLIWEYLHSKNVIYRDLKPENLLLDSKGYLKLADFGFAKVVPTRTYTLCGTPEYLAPEVILNKGHGKAVDWWTLGVLIYEMLVGIDPFNAADPMTMYQNIVRGQLKFPASVSSDCKSLIKHLLTSDLTKRYGNMKNQSQDVKDHRFFDQISWKALLDRRVDAPWIPPAPGKAASRPPRADEEGERVPPDRDPFLDW